MPCVEFTEFPNSRSSNTLTNEPLRRHQGSPEQVADAKPVECLSLSMNPHGIQHSGKSLIQITLDRTRERFAYRQRFKDSDWAFYSCSANSLRKEIRYRRQPWQEVGRIAPSNCMSAFSEE